MSIDLGAVQEQIGRGFIDPRIFFDEEIYQLEQQRIFRRTWLFVAHDSMLKKPGDYITQYMGEDPVIVVRDNQGRVRVFLNRCRHRGVRLCPFDRGNAVNFTCSYHGWSYGVDGALKSVPDVGTYAGGLDQSKWGLIEVPKVASYGGFIFANWDAGAVSLDEYLGDMRYYFDNAFGRLYAGGVEMSPVKQRVMSNHNWKIAADNGSDLYHFGITHAGGIGTLQDYAAHMPADGFADTAYLATNRADGGPSHSALAGKSLADAQAYDLQLAQSLGADSVEYIKRRYRLMTSLDSRVAPGYFSVVGLFPSILFVDMAPITAGIAVELWHPRGARKTETWLYVFVEKDAPPALKKFSALQMMRFHSFSGSVVPDDHENWERLDSAAGSPSSRAHVLNYTQGLAGDGRPAGFVAGHYEDLPGKIDYAISDAGPRGMYAHWARLMREP
jgi:phenylpropionate dioxygenase-like ring-hydroxylating dioxygenase large terminal subunit